uniref:Uncharacterized protein n=1 Tax=Setaria digitata TaxID=48799 RepID=A0A915PS21_9BILA
MVLTELSITVEPRFFFGHEVMPCTVTVLADVTLSFEVGDEGGRVKLGGVWG